MKALRGGLGCLVIFLGILTCSGISFVAFDRICYDSLSRRLPFYPEAEIIFRTHNMLSEFGMGNTVITMHSPDEPDVVRSWYGRATGEYIRSALRSSNIITSTGLRIARADWSVVRDGDGTQIILFGTCIN